MTVGKNGILFSIAVYFLILQYSKSLYSVDNDNSTHISRLDKLDPSRLLLSKTTSLGTDLSTQECHNLLVSPNQSYSIRNYRDRKQLAPSSVAIKTNVSSMLLVCLLSCGDVEMNPGPKRSSKRSTKRAPKQKPKLKDFDSSCFNQKGLHFIHLNVRSLLPKISEVRELAKRTKAAAIGITESWLDSTITDNEVKIHGYNIVRNDRNREGGGVCIYVRNNLAFLQRADLLSKHVESLWLEILLPKTKPIVTGIVYRPPDQSSFLTHFESIMNKIRSDVEIIILGDFNICFKKKSHCLYGNYSKVLNMFGLKQLITSPTRVTKKTSTTIDHILCNTSSKICDFGTIVVGLSDHFMIYCTRKVTKGQIQGHKNVEIRSLKNYTTESFNEKLSSINWSDVYNATDVNESWCNFKSLLRSVINDVAPIKQVRLKQRTEPWMSSDILAQIRQRDQLLYKFNKDKSKTQVYDEYCKLRNKTQRDIRRAKSEHFMNCIDDNKNNSKKLWQTLKELGYSTKVKEAANVVLKINGKLCYNPSEIANSFNEFFTGVASALVSKLPKCSDMYSTMSQKLTDFYRAKNKDSNKLSLSCISEDFVEKELLHLSPNKSTGLDGIPPRFLRDGASVLKAPITHIVNQSIQSGIVPNDLKTAKVIPLFKKNNNTESCNYRPVSVLSAVSKILEKAVYSQLESFLIDNKLLYEHQSGFRSSFSTDSCLISLFDHIKTQSSRGLYTGMIMIDLQKAFDTVNHTILCNKLTLMGVESVKWFRSYLSNRTQVVKVNNVTSSPLNISCGVPQGSILGPLLFLCYVNDMVISVDPECKLMLYADDSAILFSHRDPNYISSKLGHVLESCNEWLVDNKLSLHLGKTECILFGSKRKLSSACDFNIKCMGQTITGQDTVKYLGVNIDRCVSGETIAENVIKKSSSRIKYLYRQASCLNQRCRKILVSALIQCHFDYAVSAWYSGSSQSSKHRLQTTQNKMIRFILNWGPRTHVGQEQLSSLNFLNVENRVKYLKLCHVHKIFNNNCADYLHENFQKLSEVHGYRTRGSAFNFLVPKVKSLADSSFYFSAIREWNSLPGNIKGINNISGFKCAIRRLFQ